MKNSKESNVFMFGKEVPVERLDDKLERQIIGYNDQIMMVKVNFDAGGVGQLHEHYHSQVTYVVDGAFDMTIGEETKRLVGGDSFYIPPHTMHGCVCIEKGTLIDVFSPHREDFVESAKS